MGVVVALAALIGCGGFVISGTVFGQIMSLIMLLIAAVLWAGAVIVETIERESARVVKALAPKPVAVPAAAPKPAAPRVLRKKTVLDWFLGRPGTGPEIR